MSKFVEGRAFKTMGCRPQHEQLRRPQDMNGWVGGHVHRARQQQHACTPLDLTRLSHLSGRWEGEYAIGRRAVSRNLASKWLQGRRFPLPFCLLLWCAASAEYQWIAVALLARVGSWPTFSDGNLKFKLALDVKSSFVIWNHGGASREHQFPSSQ